VCAATYATNAANTNACPAGYSKITDVTACRVAAAFLGTPYGNSNSLPTKPSGCYLNTVSDPKVYLNTHATGAAAADAQPLCLLFGAPPATAAPHASGVTPWASTRCRVSTAAVAQCRGSTPRVLSALSTVCVPGEYSCSAGGRKQPGTASVLSSPGVCEYHATMNGA
jgi:hypothetical protein